MVDCFRKIIKNEGASRLYRGITPPILMEAPKRYVMISLSKIMNAKVHSELQNSPPTIRGAAFGEARSEQRK